MKKTNLGLIVSVVSLSFPACGQTHLASWNESESKQSLIRFVETVTDPKSSSFVAEADRIATFDNDGTLWSEKPVYFQALFAIDRIRALAGEHPEWKTEEPFASILKGDLAGAAGVGTRKLVSALMVAHAGMTPEVFQNQVKSWLKTARHPSTGMPLTRMVYQPMLEVLDYLRANGFKVYIVSGGGVEFLRAFAESAYKIPPEHVIGSSGKQRFEIRDGKPTLIKLPEIDFIDDKEGKPIAIQRIIGRRPLAAFGNSDGDLQMLQWTSAGEGPRFCMFVHHTDDKREWAYDKKSAVGQLDKGLIVAKAENWSLADMKKDWKRVYPDAISPESKPDRKKTGR